MIGGMFFKRKQKKVQLLGEHFYLANNKTFMQIVRPEIRDALIQHQKKYMPEDCASCIFYYNICYPTGEVSCGGCTVDRVIRVRDMTTRPPDCPLEK